MQVAIFLLTLYNLNIAFTERSLILLLESVFLFGELTLYVMFATVNCTSEFSQCHSCLLLYCPKTDACAIIGENK